ncbi:MAG: hypothetical protein M1826_004532 [Phylliscum demangeonii]|nr:MAG: hypothetical protein M1826_004532 [Phylliscum demangeonii]
MFRALKVSTESYMGDSVRVADVAIPVPLAEDQCAIIQAALRAAGLRSAIGSLVLAAQEASRANGIGEYDEDGDPPEDPPIPPELVFAVDYTRAALTIVLYVEEYGVFERIRMRHRVDLGADAMPHPADAGERYWDRVRSLVREIVQAPIEGLAPGVPHTIGQLVLLGERATKARFLQTLHDVLGEHVRFSTHARLDNDNDNDTSEWVDPVFAAAVGMAIESRKSVNELVNAGGNS